MSVTKDGDTGRWMSQIRVTDWTGKTIHKKKRGFATKKEALQWERDFISQSTGSLGMTFGDFIALYVKDMEHRLKPSTVASKKWLIDLKVTPFFKKIPLNEIKPTHVRQWQNSLTCYRDENGKPYAQTYLKCINNQLTAIFNYAVKYYGLKENPCHKAGSMGKKKADEMLFWTKDEFQTFIESMKDRPASYTVFMTMYYTGIREGELLALTPSDIDFEKKTLTVNKSYQRLGQEGSGHGAIHTAGQGQEDLAAAYFLPDLDNGPVLITLHGPVPGGPTDPIQEVPDHVRPMLGVIDLGVELDAVKAPGFVSNGYVGTGSCMAHQTEACGHLCHVIPMAHPADPLLRQALEEGTGGVVEGVGFSIFSSSIHLRCGDLAAQVVGHQLAAIANAQNRHA